MQNEAFWVINRSGIVIRLILGADDDPQTVDNVVGQITTSDGKTYAATFMTTGAIEAVLKRWKRSGEAGHGSYFWCTDLVVIPRPGTDPIIAAVEELVRVDEQRSLLTDLTARFGRHVSAFRGTPAGPESGPEGRRNSRRTETPDKVNRC